MERETNNIGKSGDGGTKSAPFLGAVNEHARRHRVVRQKLGWNYQRIKRVFRTDRISSLRETPIRTKWVIVTSWNKDVRRSQTLLEINRRQIQNEITDKNEGIW